LRAWQQRRDNIDEVVAASQEHPSEKIGPLTLELMQRAYEFGDASELAGGDSKYARLHKILRRFLKDHPAEQIVLFSTFRETLNYLGERLSADGITNIVMHGGIRESKDEILRRFAEPQNGISVLLSSEIGSEGIDLQFCRVLVNYDLPWNPMRIEQRIGRLDRLGQKANRILIWNLLYRGTIDDRIYTRLFEKLDLCRQAHDRPFVRSFDAAAGGAADRSDRASAREPETRAGRT
jgi:SNF2 family DNA or RNA helicase